LPRRVSSAGSLGAKPKEHDGNGIARTAGDRTRAVERALADPEWAKLPDIKLAQHIGCRHQRVSEVRKYLAESGKIPERAAVEVKRGGKSYTMATANIGKRADRGHRWS